MSNNGSDPINQIVMGFQKARILLTGFELGVFTTISGEGKTSKQAAQIIGADERAMDRLLNALCAVGFVVKKGDIFFNSPESAQYLVKGSPDYMGGLMHSSHLWNTWSTLTKAVKSGRSVIPDHFDNRGEDWFEGFIAAMHFRARKNAPAVIGLLDLSGVTRVLDVGGGSGAYSMAFAVSNKNIHATVFDLPNVIPLTRQYVEKEGVSDRVDYIEGDYMKDSPGKGYDLIFLSAIVHINSPEENIKLLQKCVSALNGGGQVVIQDFIMEEDRVHPANGAVFALNMLVGTRMGDTYTEGEIREWFNKVGLQNPKKIETPFGTTLIMARLPF